MKSEAEKREKVSFCIIMDLFSFLSSRIIKRVLMEKSPDDISVSLSKEKSSKSILCHFPNPLMSEAAMSETKNRIARRT